MDEDRLAIDPPLHLIGKMYSRWRCGAKMPVVAILAPKVEGTEGESCILSGKMFHMCWALSDGSPKLIPIDEQPNHQIVHLFRLRKAQGTTHEPLDPGPEIDVFAFDFLRVLLAHLMLLSIEMPLVSSPRHRCKTL